jgi:hypothetical protein
MLKNNTTFVKKQHLSPNQDQTELTYNDPHRSGINNKAVLGIVLVPNDRLTPDHHRFLA